MDISTQQEVGVPVTAVFEFLCDFEWLEQEAMRRGVTVERLTVAPMARVGSKWSVRFRLRDKVQDVQLEIAGIVQNQALKLDFLSRDFNGRLDIELRAQAHGRSCITCKLEVRARTFSARILLKSAKLMQTSIDARVADAMSTVIEQIEQRHID